MKLKKIRDSYLCTIPKIEAKRKLKLNLQWSGNPEPRRGTTFFVKTNPR